MRKAVLLVLLAAACSTGSLRPANIVKPEASVEALGTPFFGSMSDEAAIDLGVTITNRAAETLQVRSIRVSSQGMTQYVIRSINQRFHDDIAPGETKRLIVPATAVSSIERLQPSEPLLLRIEVTFETKSGKIFREVYSGQRIIF
jgi:hypothetical protein